MDGWLRAIRNGCAAGGRVGLFPGLGHSHVNCGPGGEWAWHRDRRVEGVPRSLQASTGGGCPHAALRDRRPRSCESLRLSMPLSESSNHYIDAHVHLWTDDFSRYPLAPQYKPADLAIRRFLAEDILVEARRHDVDR